MRLALIYFGSLFVYGALLRFHVFPKCDACQDRPGHKDDVRGPDVVEFSSWHYMRGLLAWKCPGGYRCHAQVVPCHISAQAGRDANANAPTCFFCPVIPTPIINITQLLVSIGLIVCIGNNNIFITGGVPALAFPLARTDIWQGVAMDSRKSNLLGKAVFLFLCFFSFE